MSAFLPKADIVLIQGVFVYFAVLHDEAQGLEVLVASGGIKPFGAGRARPLQSSLLAQQYRAARRSFFSRLEIARTYSINAQYTALIVTLAVCRNPRERDVIWIDHTKESFRTFRVGEMATKPSVALFRYLYLLLSPDPVAFFFRYGPVLPHPGPD
jgi:hypothetical protein